LCVIDYTPPAEKSTNVGPQFGDQRTHRATVFLVVQ
jgi:hypothetical protein